MARLLPLTSLVTLLTLCPRPGLAADPGHARADWPQFRGPHRDNISPDKGLLQEWPREGPAEVWKATGVGKGFSSVSVAGDKVFTMGDQGDSGFVFALDRDTGEPGQLIL